MEFIYDIEFALYIFQDTIIYHTILQSGWCTSDHQHHLYKYIKQGSSRNSQSGTKAQQYLTSLWAVVILAVLIMLDKG